MPIWQFGDGWYQRENFYRWTKPEARATLRRPDGALKLEVSVNIGTIHIRDLPKVQLEVFLDGASLAGVSYGDSAVSPEEHNTKGNTMRPCVYTEL